MRFKIVLVTMLLLTVVYSGFAYNAFVWDHENISHFPDPETGESVGSEYAISQTLAAIGIDYEMGNDLPATLDQYDVVFVLLGTFCFS